MPKNRKQSNIDWKRKLFRYLDSLSKEDLDKVREITYPRPYVDDTEIFNSGIMGSQRLIYKEITNNIPKGVKTVYVPFACGLDLPYWLAKSGYIVRTIDRMKCVEILSNYLFEGINLQEAIKVLKVTRPGLTNPGDYLIYMRSKVKKFKGTTYFLRGDTFELLPKLIVGRGTMVYLGTPTIMENNKKFYLRYRDLEKSLDSSIKDDWNKYNEEYRIRKLLELCRDNKVKWVFAGLGSGEMSLERKVSIFKDYYKYVDYIYKPYDEFDDWIIFASSEPLQIDKRLYYAKGN